MFKVGDKVKPKVGAHKGATCEVTIVEMDKGAKNGWITVSLPQSRGLALYAGEELELLP